MYTEENTVDIYTCTLYTENLLLKISFTLSQNSVRHMQFIVKNTFRCFTVNFPSSSRTSEFFTEN